jgi:hypothetical protein
MMSPLAVATDQPIVAIAIVRVRACRGTDVIVNPVVLFTGTVGRSPAHPRRWLWAGAGEIGSSGREVLLAGTGDMHRLVSCGVRRRGAQHAREGAGAITPHA